MAGQLSRRIVIQGLAAGVTAASVSFPGLPTRSVAAQDDATNELRAEDFASANIDWKQAAGTTLNVAVLQQAPWSDNLQAAMPFFLELTGIEATIQDLPEQELNDRTFTDLVARAGAFDAFHMDPGLAPQYSEAMLIEPLDQFLTDPNQTDPDWYDSADFSPSAWAYGQYNGETWALPQTADASLMSYRTDLLDAAPNTMDELMASAQELTTDARAGFTARGQRGQSMNLYTFASFYLGFGAEFFVQFPDDMHPVVNSPEASEALDFYATLLRDYGPAGNANYTWAEDQLAAQQDRAASIIEWGGHPAR